MHSAKFLLATIAASSLFACANEAPEQDVANLTEGGSVVAVQASERPDELFLADVWSVRTENMLVCAPMEPCVGSGTDVRVLEVAPPGGDPAANGTGVVVNFSRGGESFTFETGLDVVSVTGIEAQVEPGVERVFIEVLESYYNEDSGLIDSIENTYFVTVDASDLGATSIFDTNMLPDAEAETPLTASNDPRYGLVDALWNVVTTTDSVDVTVRLYEISAGDPAYNGTHVHASAWSYDSGDVRVWDTGLDVLRVEQVRFTGASELEVITHKNVFLSDESVVDGPVVYPMKLDLSDRGLGDKLLIDQNPPVG